MAGIPELALGTTDLGFNMLSAMAHSGTRLHHFELIEQWELILKIKKKNNEHKEYLAVFSIQQVPKTT